MENQRTSRYFQPPSFTPSSSGHPNTQTMMLCFWLFVFSVHFVHASSRSTASYQNGFQNGYPYRSNRNALNGLKSDSSGSSRWRARLEPAVSSKSETKSESKAESRNESKNEFKSVFESSQNTDQLLAESSSDDQYVELSMPDSTDHAYSSYSFNKKVAEFFEKF